MMKIKMNAPYTGESNAPTVGPNRPNDATYLARDSNPGPDNACTSSLSARAYCLSLIHI